MKEIIDNKEINKMAKIKEIYEELSTNSQETKKTDKPKEPKEELTTKDIKNKILNLELEIQNLEYLRNSQERARTLEKQFERFRIFNDRRDFELVKKHNHEHLPKICKLYRKKYKYQKALLNESNIISMCELCIKDYIKAFKKLKKDLFDTSKDIGDYIKRYKKIVGDDISEEQDNNP